MAGDGEDGSDVYGDEAARGVCNRGGSGDGSEAETPADGAVRTVSCLWANAFAQYERADRSSNTGHGAKPDAVRYDVGLEIDPAPAGRHHRTPSRCWTRTI